VGTGERVMYAVGTPAFTAKNRYGLPAELPMEWKAFIKSFNSTNKEAKSND
jgi:hypothetical protein